MSRARRIAVVLTLATTATTMPVTGTASADHPPQVNLSCFDILATSPAPGGPGNAVGQVASALGKTGTVGDVASQFVRPL